MSHWRSFLPTAHSLGKAALALFLVVIFALALPRPQRAEENAAGQNRSDETRAAASPGERIYRQQCASCHGPAGEGTDENYPMPLVGDRPVSELARLIAKTMPEGEPEECVGDEAEQVAAYIYDAFYSPLAQARNRPARIEFSRLTARQHEHALADLIGSFTWSGQWNGEPGLRAEYFKTRRFRNDDRVIEREDATVDFNFGASSPDPEKIEPEEFCVRWQGAVMVPDTGEYEFILETENGARLWVNDTRRALIDAWVRSGDQTEHRASIRLLGGRAYPIRLEFFKFKEQSASIRLKWKPPHQPEAVIPERNLSTSRFPRTMVVETAFPPDDRSIGYERGTSVSKDWAQAATSAAIEVAGMVTANLSELAGDRRDERSSGRRGGRGGRGRFGGNRSENSREAQRRYREFCEQFAERAFRRPLTDEQRETFIDRQFEAAADPETAVKRVVLLVLNSPRFLYRETGAGEFDDYAVASWLSFGLWDSLPDRRLLEAAAEGRLRSREQIAEQARRMVDDPRTRAKVREFMHHWLQVEHLHGLSKDPNSFPEFDSAVAADLRISLDLFLDDVLWGETSDYRRLLTADYVYLNGRLAQIYGIDLPDDAPFEKVQLDPEQRAGVLTHPYLMAGFSEGAHSSPIHRGVFVARSLLGRVLRPPPDAVSPLAPDKHPDLTTRERVILQTSPQGCMTCHGLINPLGFSLEHFDALGRYRTEELGRAIDATGSYLTRSGEEVDFGGARGLAEFLAGHDEAHEAFIERLFSYMVKQPIQAFGPNTLTGLRDSFADNNFEPHRLLVDLITTSALTIKEAEE